MTMSSYYEAFSIYRAAMGMAARVDVDVQGPRNKEGQ